LKKTYYIILALFFCLFSCTNNNQRGHSNVSSQDSLAFYLSSANNFNTSFKNRQKYNQKALAIIISQSNDSINRVNLFKVANRYYNINNWKDYKQTVHIVLEKSESVNDSMNIAKSYTYLGDYYVSQAVSDTAFMCYFKAEKIIII
jgi:hypothetical protein